ncbi:MAG: UDP-glucuronate 4-epimerase [Sphingobacteriales bacterium]
MKTKRILITGAAGFIGRAIMDRLMKLDPEKLVGLDALLPFNGLELKIERLKSLGFTDHKDQQILNHQKNIVFYQKNLLNLDSLYEIFKQEKITHVIHLAALPSIREGEKASAEAFHNNLWALRNIITASSLFGIEKLIYASSSSVYGFETELPMGESSRKGLPNNSYALSKLRNEEDALTFSKVFVVQVCGLRLFSVYGPWGRPDMAPYIFTKNLFEKNTTQIANPIKIKRDFTYIDNVVDTLVHLLNTTEPLPKILNIGSGTNHSLKKSWEVLKAYTNSEIVPQEVAKPEKDLEETLADITLLKTLIPDYHPININRGMSEFVKWYKDFYKK